MTTTEPSKFPQQMFNALHDIMSEYVREFTTEMTNVVKQSSVHFSPLNLLLGKHHQKSTTTTVKNKRRLKERKKQEYISLYNNKRTKKEGIVYCYQHCYRLDD